MIAAEKIIVMGGAKVEQKVHVEATLQALVGFTPLGDHGGVREFLVQKGADVLLTGEIKHHDILGANHLGIAVVDAGHFKTEDIVIEPLREKLGGEFEDMEFVRSVKCTDEIEYI